MFNGLVGVHSHFSMRREENIGVVINEINFTIDEFPFVETAEWLQWLAAQQFIDIDHKALGTGLSQSSIYKMPKHETEFISWTISSFNDQNFFENLKCDFCRLAS